MRGLSTGFKNVTDVRKPGTGATAGSSRSKRADPDAFRNAASHRAAYQQELAMARVRG